MGSTSDINRFHWAVLGSSSTLFAMLLASISVPRYSWIWWTALWLLLASLVYINVIYLKIFNLASRN